MDPDGRGPRPGPGPGIGSNPFYSIAEGARQIQQAAGSIIDRAYVSATTTVSTVMSKTKVFFGVGEGTVTNSIDATTTSELGTNFKGFMTDYGGNTPMEPLFKVSSKTSISHTATLEGKGTIGLADVKSTNKFITDAFTGESSVTNEVVAGKAGNGIFVSKKTTSTESRTDAGLKLSVSMPEVNKKTISVSLKAAVTLEQEPRRQP